MADCTAAVPARPIASSSATTAMRVWPSVAAWRTIFKASSDRLGRTWNTWAWDASRSASDAAKGAKKIAPSDWATAAPAAALAVPTKPNSTSAPSASSLRALAVARVASNPSSSWRSSNCTPGLFLRPFDASKYSLAPAANARPISLAAPVSGTDWPTTNFRGGVWAQAVPTLPSASAAPASRRVLRRVIGWPFLTPQRPGMEKRRRYPSPEAAAMRRGGQSGIGPCGLCMTGGRAPERARCQTRRNTRSHTPWPSLRPRFSNLVSGR